MDVDVFGGLDVDVDDDITRVNDSDLPCPSFSSLAPAFRMVSRMGSLDKTPERSSGFSSVTRF